jgi:hypothetical protein
LFRGLEAVAILIITLLFLLLTALMVQGYYLQEFVDVNDPYMQAHRNLDIWQPIMFILGSASLIALDIGFFVELILHRPFAKRVWSFLLYPLFGSGVIVDIVFILTALWGPHPVMPETILILGALGLIPIAVCAHLVSCRYTSKNPNATCEETI